MRKWLSKHKEEIVVGLVIQAIWTFGSWLVHANFDFLGLIPMMGTLFALLAYFLMFFGAVTLLKSPVSWAWNKIARLRSKPKHKITPRDFGLDVQKIRRVGFSVDPKSDVTIEMFWYSGKNKPDEMQLRYPLNVTSHRFMKTNDEQVVFAIAWELMPFGYSLVLDDGYYGLFLNPGYYKARVLISNVYYDVLIHYSGHSAIKVVEVSKRNNDVLKQIPDSEKGDWDDGETKNWSTVPSFQPNTMYKNGKVF